MDKAELDQLCRQLTDQGKLIEAGWLAMRYLALPPDTPPVQVEEMRKAFLCGAQHLFASIMGILEPGTEPTGNDMRRLDLIAKELDEFVAQLKKERRWRN